MTQRAQNQKISELLHKIINHEIPSINQHFDTLNNKINDILDEKNSEKNKTYFSIRALTNNIDDIKITLDKIDCKIDKKIDKKTFSSIITLIVTLFVAWLSVITIIAAK